MHHPLPVLCKSLLFAVVSLCLLLMPKQVQGTHAMGADLRYECLSGDTYRITLTIYRDCLGSPLTNQQNIAFESASCGVARFIEQATRVNINEISPLCPAQQPNSTCNGGIFPGVEQHIYELDFTLPQNCPDWRISWQLCCRNFAITNSIITPNTRIYIESYLNNLTVSCNNSPYFTTLPVPYLCDGEPFSFNNGAIDPDGDSLAFSLIDPRDYIGGQALPIPYQTGFSVGYPIATSPANNFNFDPLSGQFDFVPSGLQQGIVALLVEEYRNGVLIGSTMRDIQMVVINCLNQAPIVGPPTNVEGGLLNGNTFSVCAGDTLSFDIQTTDPDIPSNQLTVTGNISWPNGTFTTVGTNPVDGSFDWPTTLADTGTYFFTINAEDDGCPFVSKQSVGYNIIVQTGAILPPQDIFICPSDTALIPLLASTPNTGGTFSWSPALGLNNPNIANPLALPPDSSLTYTVTYSALGACPILEPFTLEAEALLDISADTVTICLGDSIQLSPQVNFNGQAVNFTVSWSSAGAISDPFALQPIVFPTVSSEYTLTVSTLSCTYELDIWVEVADPPVLNPITPPSVCSGDSATLVVTGTDLLTATFSWNPIIGLSNPAAQNPLAYPTTTTTYTVIATNACGVDDESVTVTVFAPMQLSFSIDEPICNGDNNGSATVVVFGGSGNGLDYAWTPAAPNAPIINNLSAGTYTVTVTDDANCTDTDSVSLDQPPPLTIDVDTVIEVRCFGQFTGSITVSGVGGSPGYEYSLDGINFYSAPNFQNLGAGTYIVTVRDDRGCTASTPVIGINQPTAPLIITVDSLRNTNCNVSLGGIWATFGGGTPGYCLSLDGGTTCQDTGYFDNLTPGLYQVMIIDTLGCTALDTANILEIADPFLGLDSITHVTCFGDSNGSVAVTPLDGTPPYQFSLNGGPLTSDTVYTGLPAGFYALELFDGIGCKYGLSFFIQEPDSLYGLVLDTDDLTCAGDFTGAVTVQGQGGTAPYLYALPAGTAGGTDSIFADLPAGPQQIGITDIVGCSTTLEVVLNEPAALQAVLAQKDDISCFGETDGVINMAALGGTPGYTYSFEGAPFVQDSVFSFLAAGTYSIVVMDNEGCTDSLTVNIIEPQPVDINVIGITDVDCYNAASGTVTVQGSGGTLPYSFAFDSLNFVASNTLTGLRAGAYVILMQDANGCLAQTEADITEPDEMIGSIDVQPITCFGLDDGQATATVNGGTPGYTYDWSNGSSGMMVNDLPPGNQIVLVTDLNGCELSLTTEVLEPPQMSIDSTDFADASCFGLADGFALAFAIGGNPPYTWDWSNGAQDSVIFDLGADTYEVAITDTNGCVLRDTFLISEPPAIGIEVVDIVDASCGLPTGQITVLATGGVEGFAYTWVTDPPQTGPTASELLGGANIPPYTVIATDSNGCTQALEIPLNISGLPEAAFTHNFAPLDTFLLLGTQEVQFINLSENAAFYAWDFGDGQLSTEVDPSHRFEELGYFEIELIAFDQGLACPDTAVLGITLLPPGAIYVANAFTPNGDGVNENFFPVGIGVEEVEMQIFTRWGPLVTTLYSMEDRWDGSFKGVPAPEGVYVWKLHAVLNDGREVDRVGTVTLYR